MVDRVLKATPLAAAPFRKFRRVVIGRLPQLFDTFPQAGRLTRRLILHFIGNHIANPDREGQSFSE
ncbi:MAG TPA: hypothetical protein VMT08_33235 [Bradyrhizobium sp.]|nr:hypothetical protein [Bradyrhizobium sp.]